MFGKVFTPADILSPPCSREYPLPPPPVLGHRHTVRLDQLRVAGPQLFDRGNALADIGLYQLDCLADAEIQHRVDASARRLRRRRIGGVEHAVDEALDLVVGDVVDALIVGR